MGVKSKYTVVKAWRARNPEKVNAQARRYRAKHPETAARARAKYRAKNREWLLPIEAQRMRDRRKADPEGTRRRMLAFKARIHAKRVALAGRPKPAECEVCERSDMRVVWDHDHATGKFRGWLCDHCNKVLGLMKENPRLLRALADYLERLTAVPQKQEA